LRLGPGPESAVSVGHVSPARPSGCPGACRAVTDFNWNFNAQAIDRAQIGQLATGEFVRRHENLVMAGQSGAGKSHLLQALSRRYCEQGYRVRYTTSADLLEDLRASLADQTLPRRVRYRQLRRQITMSRVLGLLSFHPAWQHGPQLRGPCPIPGCHSTSDRPFSVHLTRQIYYCFACRSHGNPLDLWAAVRSVPLHDAALDLCQAVNLVPPWLPTSHLIPTLDQSCRVASRAPLHNR
jgi:hypothetical protein